MVADVAEASGVARGRGEGLFLLFPSRGNEGSVEGWKWRKEDEPMDFTCVLEQSQRDRMHGSISPSLVKEPSRTIQMLKVVLICLAPPKFHVGNLKVAPEMTRRVAVRLDVMLRSPSAVLQPVARVVLVLVFRVRG